MLKKMRAKLLRFLRRVLGTEQISRSQRILSEQIERQRRQSVSLGNMVKCFFSDPGKVRASVPYQRCAEIISLLSPLDIQGAKYVRVGKDYDGGYVMLDDFQRKIDAAYSLGIEDDVSWDEAIAGRGIDVFMCDHTIKRLPKQHPKFHFLKTGVTGFKKRPDLKTLGELIAQNGHTDSKNLILKMDIEDCEWDVFSEVAPAVIDQFLQIVVELHGLTGFDGARHKKIMEVLAKIHQTHQSVHVHGNGVGVPFWAGDLVLPEFLEVTYVRRGDFKGRFIKNTRQFPTNIDQPACKYWPDIYLGDFSVDGKFGERG